MYQYNLKISIISKDTKLKDIIEEIKPLENFTHEINFFTSVNRDAIISSDVLVIDEQISLEDIKCSCKDNTKIVICTEYPEIINDNLADLIVARPINYSIFKHSMKSLFHLISTEAELFHNKMCLDQTINTIPEMLWIKDNNGIHTKVNDAFCKIVGKEKKDIEGQDHYSIWNVSKNDPNSGADACRETEMAVIYANKTLQFQESVKSGNNERQLDTFKTPLYDWNGDIIGTIGYGKDVTDLKYLSAENDVFFESVPYPVLITDVNGLIINANKQFEYFFDEKLANIKGVPYDNWIKKIFYPNRTTNRSGFVEGKTFAINGIEKIVELRKNEVKQKGNIIHLFRDVTTERILEHKTYLASITDPMTKLFNRGYFNSYMAEQKGDIALLSVDLDNFKNVNDTYGHSKGDEAIILVSEILKKSFPRDVVIRMGGDEFLIVKVGNYKEEDLINEANTLLRNISFNFKYDVAFLNLSASVGIAQGNVINDSIEEILQHSDEAMYAAKNAGKNCSYFYHIKTDDKKMA